MANRIEVDGVQAGYSEPSMTSVLHIWEHKSDARLSFSEPADRVYVFGPKLAARIGIDLIRSAVTITIKKLFRR